MNFNWTKKRLVLLALGLIGIGYVFAKDWAMREPLIEVGDVNQCFAGEHLMVSAKLTNRSPFPLSIQSVMPSCGCVGAAHEKSVPGFGVSTIEFKIDTLGRHGQVDFGGIMTSSVLGANFGNYFSIPVEVRNPLFLNQDFFSFEVRPGEKSSLSGSFWVFDEESGHDLVVDRIESSGSGFQYELLDLTDAKHDLHRQECDRFLSKNYPGHEFRPKYRVLFDWSVPATAHEVKNELRLRPSGLDVAGAKIILAASPTLVDVVVTPKAATVVRSLSSEFTVVVSGKVPIEHLEPKFDGEKFSLVESDSLSESKKRFLFRVNDVASFTNEPIRFAGHPENPFCHVSFLNTDRSEP